MLTRMRMTTLTRHQLPAPPKGFRKPIPVLVKLDVVIRQDGKCKTCGERLGTLSNTQFDHVPAIQLRGWDDEARDTSPRSNDPDAIEAKHTDCHKAKTTGRKGESKLNAVNGDTTLIAKQRRLEKQEEEFRRRLLTKNDVDEPPEQTRKYRWPKRPIRSGGFDGAKSKGNQERS